MTIQEASDKLTELCHQGHAQARLMVICESIVNEVGNFEMIGDDKALVCSKVDIWPEPPKEPPKPKKTVEACKICDNNHAYCKYGNNCRMEVEV